MLSHFVQQHHPGWLLLDPRYSCTSHSDTPACCWSSLPVAAPPAAASKPKVPAKPRDPFREQDNRFIGLRICLFRKGSRSKERGKYYFTIVGFDSGQDNAFSLQDDLGKVWTTDLLPKLKLEPDEELVRDGQWQFLPNQSSTEINPGEFACGDCFAVSSRAPCIICNPPEILEEDHYLVTTFTVTQEHTF